MAGIYRLPSELVRDIICQLDGEIHSRDSILALSLVSRRLRQATLPWIFETIELPIAQVAKAELCLSLVRLLLANQNLQECVKHVRIEIPPSHDEPAFEPEDRERDCILRNMIEELIPRLVSLKTLRLPFNDEFSFKSIIRTAGSLNCLVAQFTKKEEPSTAWEYSDAFPATVTFPTVLDLELRRRTWGPGFYGNADITREKGAALYQLLRRFQDIRGLIVGTAGLCDLWLYCLQKGLEFPLSQSEDNCQKLEKLGFADQGYHDIWRLVGLSDFKSHLRSLVDVLPLGNITKLRLTSRSCSWLLNFGKMAEITLPRLRLLCVTEHEITQETADMWQDVARFIQKNSSINELHIHGYPEPEILGAIKTCGDSLHVLVIHWGPAYRLMSAARHPPLHQISAACPSIKALSVEFCWPTAKGGAYGPRLGGADLGEDEFLSTLLESGFFKSLYEFSSVTSLEISIRLHPASCEYKSDMVVREMFSHLRAKKAGSPLLELIVRDELTTNKLYNLKKTTVLWRAVAVGSRLSVTKNGASLDPQSEGNDGRFSDPFLKLEDFTVR